MLVTLRAVVQCPALLCIFQCARAAAKSANMVLFAWWLPLTFCAKTHEPMLQSHMEEHGGPHQLRRFGGLGTSICRESVGAWSDAKTSAAWPDLLPMNDPAPTLWHEFWFHLVLSAVSLPILVGAVWQSRIHQFTLAVFFVYVWALLVWVWCENVYLLAARTIFCWHLALGGPDVIDMWQVCTLNLQLK